MLGSLLASIKIFFKNPFFQLPEQSRIGLELVLAKQVWLDSIKISATLQMAFLSCSAIFAKKLCQKHTLFVQSTVNKLKTLSLLFNTTCVQSKRIKYQFTVIINIKVINKPIDTNPAKSMQKPRRSVRCSLCNC